jgi:SAM-dependent methyltransferase
LLPFNKNSFDMIMLHDVIEHLHDSPRDLLNDLLELAKPNGLLFVTVPNAVNIRKRIDVLVGKSNLPRFEGYYWCPGPWRGHVREYVRNDLVLLADYLNLEVLELRGCDHMLEKLPSRIRPVYHFVTNYFPGWKDSWLLVARKMQGWSVKKTPAKSELCRIFGESTSYDTNTTLLP